MNKDNTFFNYELLLMITPASLALPLFVTEIYNHDLPKAVFGAFLVTATLSLSIYTAIIRKKSNDELLRLAYTDPMTGLPNRRQFQELIDSALSNAKGSNQYGALLFIDLDNFKQVNDTYGHKAGDKLLINSARIIESCVGKKGTTAKLGGDEFVVLLCGIGKTEDEANIIAKSLGSSILDSFSTSALSCEQSSIVSPSIGVALFHSKTTSVDEILVQADSAMYASKTQGKNRLNFFSHEVFQKAMNRNEMGISLRETVTCGMLKLAFQPKVNSECRLIGGEALVRWEYDGVNVSPVEFISIAEESDLIIRLGIWVLKETCTQVKRWENIFDLPSGFYLSVNVSPIQIKQPDFVEVVIDIINRSNIGRGRIKLEITESSIIENVDDVIQKINSLRKFGVEVVLDDFGTGYSSLSSLRHLPISQIKIDKSFVDHIEHSNEDETIVRIIASMGRALRVSVLAEGVETKQQYRILEMAGCNYYQGYFFGKPMPSSQFEKLFQKETLPG